MLDVEHGLVEQVGYVRVVKPVDHLAPPALSNDEPQVTQHAELVRNGRRLHPDRRRELAHRARAFAQPTKNPHTTRRRKSLHRLRDLRRHHTIDSRRTCVPVNTVTHAIDVT